MFPLDQPYHLRISNWNTPFAAGSSLVDIADAFGAGDIPDFGYLSGKAFRHGDIENVLEELSKGAGGAAAGAGILGFAKSMLDKASGNKFTKNDIKRVYFGNWLRDYSQCMDIAGLSKLSAETLVLVVSVLGFMTFGYVTEEYEVTADRLGVYLPTEHIDNPKGYAQKEGDARSYHPKLRPPVDDRELEIDERNGMKKYMATEGEEWDTSTALIRRVFKECIELGRKSEGKDGADLFEAFRLLGTGLHTLEDLMAHSNWCELGLRRMGHSEVFCHVGEDVLVDTPNGQAPPLVTGTFGGADFLHSLMGEAGDKLSQASVTDLTAKLENASQQDESNTSGLKDILSKLPIGGEEKDDKLAQSEQIHEQAKGYHFDPDNVAPPEVQKQLWDVLKWRDGVMRDISKRVEMVPGLADLMEALTNALNAYVYTLLAPYLTPILKQATANLDEGSKAVIDNDDQYEVFNNPRASDPSHSMLSKDHFGLILNEPAGLIAQVIVQHTVKAIAQAWGDNSDADRVIDGVLEAFHHPYYATGNSQVQRAMFEKLEQWFGGLGSEDGQKTLEALTKESVKDHKNKRFGSEDLSEPGYGGHSHGAPEETSRYGGNEHGGESNPYSGGGGHGSRHDESESHDQKSSYGRHEESGGYNNRNESQGHGGGGYNSENRQEERASYGNQISGYGGHSEERQEERTSYGNQDSGYGGGSHGRNEEGSYGRSEETSYGRSEENSYGRSEENSYGRSEENSYGSRKQEHDSGYGGNQEHSSGYQGSGYGQREETHQESSGYNPSYGGGDHEAISGGYGRRHEEESSGYQRREEESSYGRHEEHSGGYGRNNDNESSGYGQRHEESSGGYGQSSYGREESSGYNPSYGGGERNDDDEHHGRRRHGEDDETYGAERLNLGDDHDNDHERRREYDY
ncbi:heterokaryon incompatibility protein Het-C-domain-containing protein [Pterulicium gracile]|uniref:Heterokaryon incompatibility protein Het-C-domain-containing protein n=1 Tax=Pterulicium gracile TaxID=1884261 RepID=A0A5C3R0Q0_9AGAR|nr:heterokaryon incompatibility protein Het-C-domain-containing protein [Pterula gracilis]